MTTYYGVWSGEEWWNIGNELFHTTMVGLANAQAMVVNAMWKRNMMHSRRRHELWEVRAIGEDGLPVCGPERLQPIDLIAWVERGAKLDGMLARAEAEERQRPRLLVCKPCDLEACKAVVDAIELESQKCAWCSDTATGWVEMRARKWWHCDRCETWAREAMCADGFHEKEKP